MNPILIVDDEKSLREFLTIMLQQEGYEVMSADSGQKAVALIEKNNFDLVITDIRMRQSNGIDVLKAVKEISPHTPVVIMTAYASAETAVEAMKIGAYDYVSKPFKVEDLQIIVKNAVEKKRLSDENLFLKSALKEKYQFKNMIGKTPIMQKVYDLIEKVADSNATVLITGESGTGKELVARAIHYNGTRKNYPFVSINCGAMPETLLESELFGHEKGAFTSADTSKAGLMETANKGSFFLDEVGEAPQAIQVKLLRVLQEREFTRIGGTIPIKSDLRIIAASNKDLVEAVKVKEFREDLYYRLNVIPIHLPALRDRKDDIPQIVTHFVEKYNAEHQNKTNIKGIHSDAMRILEKYHWPGNIRELQNVIERSVVLEIDEMIRVSSLPEELVQQVDVTPSLYTASRENSADLENTLDEIEKNMLINALNQTRGNMAEAARVLDLTARSIRYRLGKYKIDPEKFISGNIAGTGYQVPVSTDKPGQLGKTLDSVEKKMILHALDKTGGVIKSAAHLLNLSFRSMRYRLQKHNIKWKLDINE